MCQVLVFEVAHKMIIINMTTSHLWAVASFEAAENLNQTGVDCVQSMVNIEIKKELRWKLHNHSTQIQNTVGWLSTNSRVFCRKQNTCPGKCDSQHSQKLISVTNCHITIIGNQCLHMYTRCRMLLTIPSITYWTTSGHSNVSERNKVSSQQKFPLLFACLFKRDTSQPCFT